MKGFKNKRGISLIVLVITIIVMIILAAAIILSLNNSGIIDKANKAKKDSDAANLAEYVNVLEAEYELGVAEASGQTKTQYINTKLAEKGYNRKVTEEGVLLTESATKAINAGIEIGDVVKYEISSKTETSDATENGYSDQNISNQTDLVWRYIGVSDNGEIMIAPDVTIDGKLSLKGKIGYLKGPDELNRLCDALYSTDKGTARSMTIEDVNKLLGYTGERGAYSDGSGNSVSTTEANKIGDIEKKLGSTLTHRSTPESGKKLEDYYSDYYLISRTGDTSEMTYPENRDYVYYTSSGTSCVYWLASQCHYVYFKHSYAYFGLRACGYSGIGAQGLLYTNGKEYDNSKALRPVVLLEFELQKTTENGSTVWKFV